MNYGEVTRADVEQLWADVIDGRCSVQETSVRARELIEKVNSENPIVERGLHTLYYLRSSVEDVEVDALIAERSRWRVRLVEFDVDPEAWMRNYFGRMLADFSSWQGPEKARQFGNKLVRQGLPTTDLR